MKKKKKNEENEKIIAYAKWNVPIHVGEEGEIVNGGDDADDMPVWPEGADVELCEDVFPAFARERAGRMGGRAHYCTLPLSPAPPFPFSPPFLFHTLTPFSPLHRSQR